MPLLPNWTSLLFLPAQSDPPHLIDCPGPAHLPDQWLVSSAQLFHLGFTRLAWFESLSSAWPCSSACLTWPALSVERISFPAPSACHGSSGRSTSQPLCTHPRTPLGSSCSGFHRSSSARTPTNWDCSPVWGISSRHDCSPKDRASREVVSPISCDSNRSQWESRCLKGSFGTHRQSKESQSVSHTPSSRSRTLRSLTLTCDRKLCHSPLVLRTMPCRVG